jgi:hypothetical protein
MLVKKIYFVILLLMFSIYSVQAFAWISDTKKLFEDDEYEQVIEIAKEHKNDKDRKIGLMFLTFSHLQRYELKNTKSDKTLYKNYLEFLEDSITVSHLDDLNYFIEQADKPDVVKVAQKVLKGAFKNISDVKYTPKLINFIKSDNKKTRKIALKTVKRLFKNKRKFVKKGGTLRDEGIIAMQDEKLIRLLLDNAKDSKARDALISIERPVLAYLPDYEGKAIAKIEKKILKAIAKREKKYPESTWYSATGKIRDVAVKFSDE